MMPLEKSKSRKALGKNIKELMSTGKYGEKQAAAIGLSVQKKAKPKAKKK